MEHEKDLTVSVEEATRFCGISRSYGYHLARSGTLPGVFRLGRRYRVSKSTLLAYLKGWRPPKDTATEPDGLV